MIGLSELLLLAVLCGGPAIGATVILYFALRKKKPTPP